MSKNKDPTKHTKLTCETVCTYPSYLTIAVTESTSLTTGFAVVMATQGTSMSIRTIRTFCSNAM